MDENKNVNPNDEKEVKGKEKGKEKKQSFWLKRKFIECKGEFEKIIWPSRKDLTKESLTVIITSIIFGIVICGMDLVFSYAYQWLVILIG